MEKLENKATITKIETKSKDDGTVSIKAYALAFNNVDSYGDVIIPTACDKWLQSSESERLALCYQHDITAVVGVITNKGVDHYGLWIEADILPTTEGKDLQILLKAGAIKEFSIGYYTVNSHWEIRDENDVRVLDEIKIIEVSPVTRAANPKAILVDIKSETSRLKQLSDTDIELLKKAVDEEYMNRVIRNL